ncbi:hypothetical protein [Francisella sp. SYW-9]|uniref:hypothetical protein n=1 Tax=Francisella sp. SYW-9 TaxID=2610888 RepID=UPI00168D0D62|nr:hypothetical protein [Francisella sp. SYW-9]
MPKKGIKSLKKARPSRVAIPTDLHLWLRRRAAQEGEFIQDIVANSIKYYRKMVEKEEG